MLYMLYFVSVIHKNDGPSFQVVDDSVFDCILTHDKIFIFGVSISNALGSLKEEA